MKELADQMKDAMANLKSQHGLTAEQANAIAAQAVAPLVTQIYAIQATELSTEEKLTKVTAAVQEVADTFAPQSADTGTATGASAPATGTDAPTATDTAEPATDASPAA